MATAKKKTANRGQARKRQREIIHAIRLEHPGVDGATVITPGMEDELEELYESFNSRLPEDQQFDVQAEINRLETIGSVKGFGDPDLDSDLETRIPDPNIRAVSQKVRQQAEATRAVAKAVEKNRKAAEKEVEDDEGREKRNMAGGRRAKGKPASAPGIDISGTAKRSAKTQKHTGPGGEDVEIDHGADEIEDDDLEPDDDGIETPQTGDEGEEPDEEELDPDDEE